ncbi:MAG: PAS domain S-box protein [Sphingobacteriales bacterium]|nr:MAG: PAS domain S-box protein [Sphingobacteriales bacterium]
MLSSMYRFRRLAGFCGGFLFCTSVLVLLGWHFQIRALSTWVPDATPMNPVSAICFAIAGVWLFAFILSKRWLAASCSFTLCAFGALHFFTYFFPSQAIRIDFLLYEDAIKASGVPNLIAPNTALNFMMCGASMFLTGQGKRKTQYTRQALVIVSFLLAYISILGYVFNIQPAYRFGGLTPMALVTAVSFLVLNLALFFTDYRHGVAASFCSPFQNGRLLQLLVPFILIFPPVESYLRVLGERNGLYPSEVGVELASFIFTLGLLLFISFYAVSSNKHHQAEYRMKALMETLGEGLVQFDAQGTINYSNPAFQRIFGYSSEELLGSPGVVILGPVRELGAMKQSPATPGSKDEGEYVRELVSKTGRKMFIAIRTVPVNNAFGHFDGTLVNVRDITSEVLNLEDIKAFTASAAHDLRSPVGNIQALVQMIETEGMKPGQKEILGYINDTAGNMRILLDDLMTFSRMGSAALEMELVDLQNLVQEVAGSNANTVTIDVPEGLNVLANRGAARQLLTNLISNAIKYSSKVSFPMVTVSSSLEHGQTWLHVSDNGVGLKEDQLNQLFTPFKRFTTDFEGHGLGLAIVKRIVERHGGSIYATLNNPSGLIIHFTIDAETPVHVSCKPRKRQGAFA